MHEVPFHLSTKITLQYPKMLQPKIYLNLKGSYQNIFSSLLKPLEEYGRVADYGYHARVRKLSLNNSEY